MIEWYRCVFVACRLAPPTSRPPAFMTYTAPNACFKASGARRVPPGSMLRSVRGKHTLQTLEEQKLR
eukprot:5348752-Pleurochrysis_carterae.AAC.4